MSRFELLLWLFKIKTKINIFYSQKESLLEAINRAGDKMQYHN